MVYGLKFLFFFFIDTVFFQFGVDTPWTKRGGRTKLKNWITYI